VEVAYYLAKFLAGGILVVLFAVISEMFQPKRFAGLFAAGPLGSLGLTHCNYPVQRDCSGEPERLWSRCGCNWVGGLCFSSDLDCASLEGASR
jgi:hypothetical protein